MKAIKHWRLFAVLAVCGLFCVAIWIESSVRRGQIKQLEERLDQLEEQTTGYESWAEKIIQDMKQRKRDKNPSEHREDVDDGESVDEVEASDE